MLMARRSGQCGPTIRSDHDRRSVERTTPLPVSTRARRSSDGGLLGPVRRPAEEESKRARGGIGRDLVLVERAGRGKRPSPLTWGIKYEWRTGQAVRH